MRAAEEASEDETGTETPNEDTGEPRRSWWRRFFSFTLPKSLGEFANLQDFWPFPVILGALDYTETPWWDK